MSLGRVQDRGPTQESLGNRRPHLPLRPRLRASRCQRPGGMKASSLAFLPQPRPPVSKVWKRAKGPTPQKERGEQSSQQSPECTSYQPGAGKTPEQNERKIQLVRAPERSLRHVPENMWAAPRGPACLGEPPGTTFAGGPQPGGRSGPSRRSPTLFPGERSRMNRCFRLRRARRSWHFS